MHIQRNKNGLPGPRNSESEKAKTLQTLFLNTETEKCVCPYHSTALFSVVLQMSESGTIKWNIFFSLIFN